MGKITYMLNDCHSWQTVINITFKEIANFAVSLAFLLIWLALLHCHTTSSSTINHEHPRVICYDREPCMLIKESFSFIPLYYVPPFVILIKELYYTTP